MPYKTIKEVCMLTGVTESALRYYDEKGVLSPTMKNTSGRREWLYDSESIRQLKLIMLYRRAGLSIDDIRNMCEGDAEARRQLLDSRYAELRTERDRLENRLIITGILALIEKMTDDGERETAKQQLLDKLCK